MTGTVTSSGRGGTAAAMAQNKQTAEKHSTLEQQLLGRLDHLAITKYKYCSLLSVSLAVQVKLKLKLKTNLYSAIKSEDSEALDGGRGA